MSSLSSLSPEPAPAQAPTTKTAGKAPTKSPRGKAANGAASKAKAETPSKGRKRKAAGTADGEGAEEPVEEEERKTTPRKTPRKGANGAHGSTKKAKVEDDDEDAEPPEKTTSKRGRGKAVAKTPKPEPAAGVAGDAPEPPPTTDSAPAKKPRAKKTPADPFSAELRSAHPPRSGPPSGSAGAEWRTPAGRPTHLIGAHTSTAGGPGHALMAAGALGANALALFLKNQRRWVSEKWGEEVAAGFRKLMVERDMDGLDYPADCILPHGSYLINLGNPDAAKRETSYQCFLDDLQRCEELGIGLYNWHPGSTVGQCTIPEACKNVADSINRAHKETKSVVCVIENMAGAGNILGSTFEQLADIISHVEDKSRVGVCIDTCHTFAAGYDLRTRETYEATIAKFDEVVGLKYLRGMHLNDSQGGGFNCKKDRHQNIGLGEIGLAAFRFLVRDKRLTGIPLILETPTFEEHDVWAREIRLLYELQSLEGTDEEVAPRLEEMTQAWRTELEEMRRVSGKGPQEKKEKQQQKAAKKREAKKAEKEAGGGKAPAKKRGAKKEESESEEEEEEQEE